MRLLCFIALLFNSTASVANCLTSTQLWNRIEELRELRLEGTEELRILGDLKRNIEKCRYRPDSSYVNLLLRFGAVHYYLEDYSTAQVYALDAITKLKSSNQGMKQSMLPKAFFNYAMILRSANDNINALSAFDSSISTAGRFPGNELYTLLSYKNLAVIYYFLGDFQKSVSHGRKAQIVAQQLGNGIEEALAMCEEALALEALGDYKTALRVMTAALQKYQTAIAKEVPDPYYDEELANLYASNGNILRKVGKANEAIAYQLKAFDLYKKIGYSSGCFVSLNNVGFNFLHALSRPEKARHYFRRALQYATSYNDSIHYFTNMGDVAFSQNQPEHALVQYEKGLASIPSIVARNTTTENVWIEKFRKCSQKEYVLTLLIQKGKAQKKIATQTANMGLLNDALSTFMLADKVIDLMLFEQEANESKLVWRQKAHELYEQAIEVCFNLKNADVAFHFFEKSRAVILNEELNKVKQLFQRNEKLFFEYSTLRKNIADWNRKLSDLKQGESEYQVIFNKLFDANKKMSLLENKIKSVNPAYYSSYVSNLVVSIEDVRRKLLDDHQAVLEFFEGDSAVFLLTVTRSNSQIRKLNKEDYEHLVDRYMMYLSSPSESNRNYNEYVKTSMELYRQLFDGLHIRGGRIIVSPDGRFLPIEALIKELQNGQPRYVLHDFSVSYAFSLKTLINHNGSNNTNKAGLLGMAPVNFATRTELSSLTGSEASLVGISEKIASSSVFTKTAATKANFLKHISNYKIIQLYTHASEKGPYDEPAIYFSDSALNLSELVTDQWLNAELVVLSACETALGKVNKGEGVFSFSRGFSALGIPSSIANLWQVEDNAMYELTELFYDHLMKGEPKDIAMQNAKLEFLEKNSGEKLLPYFWASTILTGNDKRIFLQSSHARGDVAIVLGGAFSGILIFWFLTLTTAGKRKASSSRRKQLLEASHV